MAVYLVGSGHGTLLGEVAVHALVEARGKGAARPRVCAVLAATDGDAKLSAFMRENAEALFPGADVEPFLGEREAIDRADVVFVGGGDAALGARGLARSGADAWLREARARGTSIVGVSAGTIMLGAWWADWPHAESPGDLVACTGVVPDMGSTVTRRTTTGSSFARCASSSPNARAAHATGFSASRRGARSRSPADPKAARSGTLESPRSPWGEVVSFATGTRG